MIVCTKWVDNTGNHIDSTPAEAGSRGGIAVQLNYPYSGKNLQYLGICFHTLN
jgi:hypothetical protein